MLASFLFTDEKIFSGHTENLQNDWQNASAATKKKDDAIKCLRTRLMFSHWRHHSASHKWLTVHKSDTCRSWGQYYRGLFHGRRFVGGQGDISPLLFEVEGTPCVLSPLLSGVDIFCNAQLHSNNYSLQFIWWMLTPLGPNRGVPFHVVITMYDNDVNVMSPLCSYVAPQTLYIWYNRNRQVDN